MWFSLWSFLPGEELRGTHQIMSLYSDKHYDKGKH